MRHYVQASILFFATVIGVPLTAQETPEFPQPTKEHEWLKKFEGKWESVTQCKMGPGAETTECTGTIHCRMLGGFWSVSELKSEMMGTAVTAVQTIGYNTEKKKYVGTWIDSMFNYMWNYEGTVDKTGNILTLEAEGPNFMTGSGTTRFRDSYEFKSADHIVLTSSAQDEDGKWITFVTGESKRVK